MDLRNITVRPPITIAWLSHAGPPTVDGPKAGEWLGDAYAALRKKLKAVE